MSNAAKTLSSTDSPALVGWSIVGLSALITIVLLWLTPESNLRDQLGYGLRVTVRVAFIMFLLAYIARPWQQLTGTGRWLLRHRRYFGLSAALTHTAHFGYIVALFTLTEATLEITTAVFGGLAYVLIWFMAFTSNRAAQRRMGMWWSRLHRFGMHYLWLIFMQAFAGVAIATGEVLYVAIAALGLVALMLRIAASVRQRFSFTA